MTQTNVIKTVENLITQGHLSEADLVSFANEKLRGMGLQVATTEVQKRSTKARKSQKAEATKSRKARSSRKEYEDGRTNKHAILFAISQFEEGCKSKELQDKLTELGHSMESNVFNTQLSVLNRKENLIKARGKAREYTYSLNVNGKKVLEELEASSEEVSEEEAESEEVNSDEDE